MSDDFPTSRRCSLCGEMKPRSEFHRDARRPDGMFPQCKRCRRKDPAAYDEQQQQRAAGLRRCTTCREWLAPAEFYTNPTTPDGLHRHCRRCACRTAAEARRAAPDKARRIDFERYWRDRDAAAERYRIWQRSPLGKAAIARRSARRKQRSAMTPCDLTAEEWAAILAAQNHRCAACQRAFSDELPPTRDHIVPLLHGGGLTKDNVQGLCRSCNARKKTRTIDYRKP